MEGDDRQSRRSRGNARKKSSSAQKKSRSTHRTKSGCYTCRIRRKKCDEKPNDEGQCENCVRLHLECLGFGEKRPEWMRDPHKIVDMRESIKNFLSSRGMIKGVGHGRADPAPAGVLRLSDIHQQDVHASNDDHNPETSSHGRRHNTLFVHDTYSEPASTPREIHDDHDWRHHHSSTFDPRFPSLPVEDHHGYPYPLPPVSNQESLPPINTLNPPVNFPHSYSYADTSYDHFSLFDSGSSRQLPSIGSSSVEERYHYSSHSSSSPSASESYSSSYAMPISTLRQHSISRTSSRASERGHIGHGLHTASVYLSPSPEVAAHGAVQGTEESTSRLSIPLSNKARGKKQEWEPSPQ